MSGVEKDLGNTHPLDTWMGEEFQYLPTYLGTLGCLAKAINRFAELHSPNVARGGQRTSDPC